MKIDDNYFDEVEGDADTIAGLLLEIKGDFPKPHEKLSFGKFHFEVLKTEERRLAKIKVLVQP